MDENLSSLEELDQIERQAFSDAEDARQSAWDSYLNPNIAERDSVIEIIDRMRENATDHSSLSQLKNELLAIPAPLHRDNLAGIRKALMLTKGDVGAARKDLIALKNQYVSDNIERYDTHLYSENQDSTRNIEVVSPTYPHNPDHVYGFEILNACFDAALSRDPRVIIFGQDVGNLGGVNQALKGLQTVPDLVFDDGDVGKEPMIRVLGQTPMEVAEKVVRIGKAHGEKGS